jgi:transcriptional regulator with XRE-family HTH domain
MRTLPEVFGDAVRRLRKDLEPSQEKFAARAGISRTYMSEIERGVTNLSLDTIDRVAKALGLTLAQLFYEVDTERVRRFPPARKHDV